MEIIVGREEGAVSPGLSIKNGSSIIKYGEPGSVPKTVSRSHARISEGGDGSITVALVAEKNVLYINGIEYTEKKISDSDLVELGPDRYVLDVKGVIAAAKAKPQQKSAPGKQEAKEVDITHLKKIFEDYSSEKSRLQIRERKINAYSALPSVLSMTSIALAFVFGDTVRIVMIALAVIMIVAFAVIRVKLASKVPQMQQELTDKFEDMYVCPNPECHHFLGQKKYKMLVQDGQCPYCRSIFKDRSNS